MRKKIAAAGIAVALAGGGAGLALVGPSLASAADSSTSTGAPAAAEDTRPDPKAFLTDALKPLVDAATITQAQADAVVAALEQARPEGPGPGRRGPGLDAAATAVGIDTAALRTELQAGKTIAEVAADRGVAVQAVIDAVVADLQGHLADAVASGRMTQAQADERSAQATEHATDLVNGKAPTRPLGGGFPGGPPNAPATSSPAG